MKNLTNVPKYLLSALGQHLASGKRPVAKFIDQVIRNSGLQFLTITLGAAPIPVLIPVYVTAPHHAKRRR